MTGSGRLGAALRPLPLGLGLALLLAGGCVVYTPPPPIPAGLVPTSLTPEQFANEKLYLETWQIVRQTYFDPQATGPEWVNARNRHLPEVLAANDTAGVYQAINAMIAELKDSHTAAFTPQEAKEEYAKEKARCGFQLVKIDSAWLVRDVWPDSPAQEAGVKVGWTFLSEDGVPADQQKGFKRVVGQVIHDSFLDRQMHPVDVTMVARELPMHAKPQERMLPGGILYLRFDDFELQTRHWLAEQLKAHQDAPAAVIDLRANPGGSLVSLDLVIGDFFPGPVTMGTFVTRSGFKDAATSLQIFPAHYAGQVAILTGPLSASSSEIFSDTLQFHKRALLVGQKTAGAVRGSLNFMLPDGGEVQISLSNYLSLAGGELEGKGVRPDVEVRTTQADLRAGQDPDLQAALLRLRPERSDGTH